MKGVMIDIGVSQMAPRWVDLIHLLSLSIDQSRYQGFPY